MVVLHISTSENTSGLSLAGIWLNDTPTKLTYIFIQKFVFAQFRKMAFEKVHKNSIDTAEWISALYYIFIFRIN